MSIAISRFKKLFSLQVDRVAIDSVGRTLLARISELLAQRTDVTRPQFLRAIGRPTPSWGSEFFNGQRTTNNLRLLLKIAKYFGVSVGYLLNEGDNELDTGAVTLLAAWEDMDEAPRRAILNMALTLKGRSVVPRNGQSPEPPPGHDSEGGTKPAPKKRR